MSPLVDKITLSIDPATHGCGCALFRAGKLLAAGYAPNKVKNTDEDILRRSACSAKAAFEWWEAYDAKFRNDAYVQWPHELVVEMPPVYTAGKGNKGDQNEIVVPLAMVDGALAVYFPNAGTFSYKPYTWKKTTSKPPRAYGADGKEVPYVIKERVKDRLKETGELAAVDWSKSVEHSWDVADAIGVGLHHLGRFERKRVYPRE